MRFIAEGTRSNQLFLHSAVAQNVHDLQPIYDWFAKRLNVVGVGAMYSGYTSMLLRDDFMDFVNRTLERYGTGVHGMRLQDVSRDTLDIPEDFLQDCIADMPAEGTSSMQIRKQGPGAREVYVLTSRDGQISYQKIILVHEDEQGLEVPFTLSQESAGTRRLISLMPAIFDLASADSTGDKVYVIDELDRSFHTALTSDIVHMFLAACANGGHSQLIFSTHDLLLMDDDAIRRDEQWICESVPTEGTKLTSIGRHNGVRKDTSLLKSYQKGVFGGFPAV